MFLVRWAWFAYTLLKWMSSYEMVKQCPVPPYMKFLEHVRLH